MRIVPAEFQKRWWQSGGIGCYCDGDPGRLMWAMARNGNSHATQTQIGTSTARLSFFVLDRDKTVTTAYMFGFMVNLITLQTALYEYGGASDSTRLSNQVAITSSDTSGSFRGGALGSTITLKAGVVYFQAVSTTSTSSNAAFTCINADAGASTGQIAVAPESWPGNLQMSKGFCAGGFAQASITSGALPSLITAANIVAQGTWSGGWPAVWLA